MTGGQGTTPDELSWWSAAKTGDGDAFGRVFDLHHDRVYRHAGRVLDVRADAEDVAAAAFLELWRRRESVRLVNGSVLPWLLVTTSNLSRNARRATRRYRALLERLPRAGATPDHAELLLDADQAGWDSALVEHLRGLNRSDRALITLVALEGFTIADTADALGISLAAAKSRLHRIRRRPGLKPATQQAAATHTSPEMRPVLTSERSHP